MTKYATIVFLNDYEDETVDNFLNGEVKDNWCESAEDNMVDYLSQWDYGEYNAIKSYEDDINTSSFQPWGSADTVYEQDNSDYILSYNRGLGYVSLAVKLEDED